MLIEQGGCLFRSHPSLVTDRPSAYIFDSAQSSTSLVAGSDGYKRTNGKRLATQSDEGNVTCSSPSLTPLGRHGGE